MKWFSARRDSSHYLLLVVLVVLVSMLIVLRDRGYLQFLELAAYDMLVARATRDSDWKPPIVLIEIAEGDIQRLGNWPLYDNQLADILESLLSTNPCVLGLDIYRDFLVAPGSERLQRLFRENSRLRVIEKFPTANTSGIPAPAALIGTDRVGFADLVSDPGGIIRRNLLFQNNDMRVSYSLGLRLALAYLAEHGVVPQPDANDPSLLRLGSVTLYPLDGNAGGYVGVDTAGYQILLDYIGGEDPFIHYSLADWWDGRLDPAQLRGKIVLVGVGAAAESVKDSFATPHAIFSGYQGTVSGGTLHAHAMRQLLEIALHARPVRMTWSEQSTRLWLGGWITLGLLAGWYAGTLWRLVLLIAIGVITLLGSAVLGFYIGWWLPLVPPLLGGVTAAALSTALLSSQRRREQQMLMGLFARHVSPTVADTIWQRREEVLSGGQIRPQVVTATVLFTDLQGFTQISESLAPEPFLEWLNSYMGAMTDIILQWGGMLDDYAGDSIKANFGVPLARLAPEHIAVDAQNAVRCALALGDELERLNRYWEAQQRPRVGMRIGVHTGTVVVGSVGSALRMKYTTVGSQVNLASRLESLKEVPGPDAATPGCGCRILISSATAERVKNCVRLSSLGLFALRGIRHETEVFLVS